MSEKLKSTFSISDPAMANAAKRRLERLQEQQRIADEERRLEERDRVGVVTLGRTVDYDTSVTVRRIAAHFRMNIDQVLNILAFGKFIVLDEELGVWRRREQVQRVMRTRVVRRTWRAP